jgi:hypothetical protein
MDNTWQRLAWTEWRRSFFKGQPNRDFWWLTILLFLTLILALLLWGGREGLLNKFVDISVGYIEDTGIPIWLATNNIRGIDSNLLQNKELSQQNIKLYPYHEVECHEVNLPNQVCGFTNKIWDETKVNFDGWAVSVEDPLWKMGITKPSEKLKIQAFQANRSGLPLEIILNKSLFTQYFNCPAYRNALQAKQLPFTIPNIQADKLSCLANGILWLELKINKNKELIPFQIHWQSHIPTMQNLAFLFPLSTLNTLKLVVNDKLPALRYYPEAQANQITRIKALKIKRGKEELSVESMEKLTICLQNPETKRYQLTLTKPLPKTWVAACAKQSGIPLKGENKISRPFLKITDEFDSHYFQYDRDGSLTLSCRGNSPCPPCQKILALQDKLGENVTCDATQAKIHDIIAATGSYQRAFAYVESRTDLATQIEKLKNFQLPEQDSQAFYIHPTYDDALVRFQFIDAIMIIINKFYSPFFLAFLIILLLVQVGIVITHRQHNYGILLAKGMSGGQVRRMVFLQIGISFGAAIFISILIGELMQGLLAWQLESVITQKPFIDHIIASQLDLLPLSWLDYLLVGGIALIILSIITAYLLKRLVLNRQMEPAYLF